MLVSVYSSFVFRMSTETFFYKIVSLQNLLYSTILILYSNENV